MSEPSFDERKLSFGDAAAEYDTYRPTYPASALRWVFDGAVGDVVRVGDVGAGTGALSSVLVDEGFEVSAFEPDEGMLAQLRQRLPSVRAVASRAETLPVEDGAFDALVVGQAFHWFDHAAAAHEFARALRPGGVVGLLWNLRDDGTDWLAQLRPIIDGQDWHKISEEDAKDELRDVFPNVERAEFRHVVSMTPAQILGLVETFSYVRLHAQREQILQQVRDLLANHPETRGRDLVDMPYVTATYRARPTA